MTAYEAITLLAAGFSLGVGTVLFVNAVLDGRLR